MKDPIVFFVTGVVSLNSLEHIHEDMYNGDEINLAFIDHLEECHKDIDDDHDDCWAELDVCDRGDILIGLKETTVKLDAMYWYERWHRGFTPDPEAEYSAIVREDVAQIVKSKWFAYCHKCSPCYPQQGDLDTAGDYYKAYAPPADLIGDHGNQELISRLEVVQDEINKWL